MRIDRITLYLVRMHLKHAFAASSHAAGELNHIVVRAESGKVVGWGECSLTNDPFYMGETYETAWHMLKDFILPRVIGKEWEDVEAFTSLYRIVKGNPFAKSGLETAAWDLLGRARGVSVASLLGGERATIASGVSLGMEKTHEALLEHIRRHVAEGYKRVKMKIAPGHDIDVVSAVRAEFPDLRLMVDANAAYTLNDVAHLQKLDPYKLEMIEQPLAYDDIIDHATLQRQIKTPVCLDESIRNVADAKNAIDLGSCKIINVKVARVGGLLAAKRIHDVCVAREIAVWCGGMHDYGVGRAANVALASLRGFTLPGDISGSDKYFDEDIIEPHILAHDGEINVPQGPGLGHEVVESRIRARSVRELRMP